MSWALDRVQITDYYLKIFNKALSKGNFNIIETKEFTLDYEVQFACCGGSQIDIDLKGNVINNLFSSEIAKLFFLNIFPIEGKTIILFSYLKEDICYSEVVKQLEKFDIYKKKQFFNILIASSIENIAVNPDFWESFTKEEKDSFYAIFSDFNNIIPILENRNLFDSNIKYDFFREYY